MAAPTVRGSTTYFSSSSETAHNVPQPPDAATDDEVYEFFATDQPPITITQPSGFTTPSQFDDLQLGNSGDKQATGEICYKTWDSGDPSTYQFTQGTGERSVAVSVAFTGVGGAPVIDNTNYAAYGKSQTATFGSVTTSGPDHLAVAVVMTDRVTETVGTPAGYTLVNQIGYSSAATVAVFVKTMASAGTETPGNASLSGGIDEEWGTFVFALPPISAAAYTLTAGQGSFVLTGQACSLERHYPFVFAQGAFALTGQDASLERDYSFVFAQGSFVLTGQAAAFAKGYTLTAAQGAYTLAGLAAARRRRA